jgi:hypothetical protein
MQVRFNRVLKHVPVKVPGGFGAEPGQEKVPEKVWEALVQSQGRFRRRFQEALVQSQVRFNRICGHLIHAKPVEAFPALGFAARFRQILKIKRCGCWGYHRSLFFFPGCLRRFWHGRDSSPEAVARLATPKEPGASERTQRRFFWLAKSQGKVGK